MAFVVTSQMPKIYRATATLILLPPKFSTELRPAPLSVETYQSILRSDYITSKLKSGLVSHGVIEPGHGIGAKLRTMIFPGKVRDEPYRPLIDLVVQTNSPEKAEKIANIWADVFVVESAGLASRGKKGTLEFINTQYPAVSKVLRDQESELKDKEDYYDQALLRLEGDWSEKILDFGNESQKLMGDHERETGKLIGNHEKETEKLKLEFADRWKPDLMKGQLGIKTAKLANFEDDLLDTELAIKTSRDKLQQIRQEIQSQPKYLVLSKAIMDEALWDRISKEGLDALPEHLENLKLRSEQINPVYMTLLKQLTSDQITYDTLVPKKEHLINEIERLRGGIDQFRDRITTIDIDLFALTKNRETDLFALTKDRETDLFALTKDREVELKTLSEEGISGLALLEKTKDSEIGLLKREAGYQTERLRRERDNTKVAHASLATKYESARLAEVEESEDVKIGAYAERPDFPVGPRTQLNTMIAAVIGLVMSVLLAFFLGYIETVAVPKSAKAGGTELAASSAASPQVRFQGR